MLELLNYHRGVENQEQTPADKYLKNPEILQGKRLSSKVSEHGYFERQDSGPLKASPNLNAMRQHNLNPVADLLMDSRPQQPRRSQTKEVIKETPAAVYSFLPIIRGTSQV
jgi:hypothetical protein